MGDGGRTSKDRVPFRPPHKCADHSDDLIFYSACETRARLWAGSVIGRVWFWR